MANSFWGGMMSAVGPMLQNYQENSLKQRMLDMQMQEYQAKQQKAQAEAEARLQKRQLIERWKTAKPEERSAIEREISLTAGKIPGQTAAEQYTEIQKARGGGGPGVGDASNPYATGLDTGYSYGPRGMTITETVRHPTGNAADIQGQLYSYGLDPNNREAQQELIAIQSMPPEERSYGWENFKAKWGASSVPQQRQPQQQQQGGYDPTQTTALGPTGKKFDLGGGKVATELSITVTDPRVNGGKPTNIPLLTPNQQNVEGLAQQVGNGGEIPQQAEDRAIQWAAQRGGFPAFNSIEEAVSAAQQRSSDKNPLLAQGGGEEGIEAVGPDGKPVYFDNRATYDEYNQRGFPLGPQGGASQPPPQQVGGGGSPREQAAAARMRAEDIKRQRDVDAAVRQAGGTKQAQVEQEILKPGEQEHIDTLKEVTRILGKLQPGMVPSSAVGPVEGSKAARYIGERAPEGFGGNTEKQGMAYAHLEELESIRALSRGGKTFTPSEQARIEANFPTSDMSEAEFARRVKVLTEIASVALERNTRLMTKPRKDLRESLDVQAPTELSRPQEGGAQEGAIIRNPNTGARLRLQNGRWTPVGP